MIVVCWESSCMLRIAMPVDNWQLQRTDISEMENKFEDFLFLKWKLLVGLMYVDNVYLFIYIANDKRGW